MQVGSHHRPPLMFVDFSAPLRLHRCMMTKLSVAVVTFETFETLVTLVTFVWKHFTKPNSPSFDTIPNHAARDKARQGETGPAKARQDQRQNKTEVRNSSRKTKTRQSQKLATPYLHRLIASNFTVLVEFSLSHRERRPPVGCLFPSTFNSLMELRTGQWFIG